MAGLLLLSGLVAGVSAVATIRSVGDLVCDLDKPPFNPPNWVFGPAWTILYILMTIATWRIWRLRGLAHTRIALQLYGAQLLLNLLWSLIFFGAHQISVALIDIVALLGLLIATVFGF